MNNLVPQHWFIVAQVLGLVALVVVFITFQTKNKVRLLVLDAIANLLLGLAYLAMGLYILAVVNLIAAVRGLAFAWLNNKREEGKVHPAISIGLLMIFWIVFAVAIVLLWSTWVDFVILGLVLVYVWSLWNKGNHLVRILCLILSVIYVTINVLAFNIMGTVVESVYILSIMIFYLRLIHEKRKKKV